MLLGLCDAAFQRQHANAGRLLDHPSCSPDGGCTSVDALTGVRVPQCSAACSGGCNEARTLRNLGALEICGTERCTCPPPPHPPPPWYYGSIQYANEVPEWKMEKNRYYVELPGDVWEEGTLMQLIKDNQEKRVGAGAVVLCCAVLCCAVLKPCCVRPGAERCGAAGLVGEACAGLVWEERLPRQAGAAAEWSELGLKAQLQLGMLRGGDCGTRRGLCVAAPSPALLTLTCRAPALLLGAPSRPADPWALAGGLLRSCCVSIKLLTQIPSFFDHLAGLH